MALPKNLNGREMHLHCNLKAILKREGMSQRELAEKSGVGLQMVNVWCNNAGSEPGAQNAMRVAHVLGCTIEDIWTLKSGKRPA